MRQKLNKYAKNLEEKLLIQPQDDRYKKIK